MKTRTLKRSLVLVTLAAGTLAIGCELIVDFDRSKIPVELPDGPVVDAAGGDDAIAPIDEAGVDAEAPEEDAEAPEEDAGADAEADADTDADAG